MKMIRIKEKGSVAVKAVRKARTASPSTGIGGGSAPPRRPVEVAASGEDPRFIPMSVSLTAGEIEWLRQETFRRKKRSRSEVIRELIAEARK